jgi:preprotein translocase subunit YajC
MAIACWIYLSTWRIPLAADADASAGIMQFVILFVPLFAIWYFLVIMPQQRQRKKTQEMLSNLKTGDRVLTSGGVYGTIAGFREEIVQLQVASQVKIDVARSAITGLQSADGATQAAGGSDSGKKDGATKGKN